VRSRPSLKAPPVGMLVLGNCIGVSEYIVNSEGLNSQVVFLFFYILFYVFVYFVD